MENKSIREIVESWLSDSKNWDDNDLIKALEQREKEKVEELKGRLLLKDKNKKWEREHHKSLGEYGKGYCDASEQLSEVMEEEISRIFPDDKTEVKE